MCKKFSIFFSLQNEKYPVTEVSCNKGVVPGGKTAAFLLFTSLDFKYLSNVAPQLTAAAADFGGAACMSNVGPGQYDKGRPAVGQPLVFIR